MVGSIQANATSLVAYGKQMASVSNRISKAFREDADVNVAAEFAKSTIVEHGHRASLKVLRVQEDMADSVLDIIA